MIRCKSNIKVKIQTLPRGKLKLEQIGLMTLDSQDYKAPKTWKKQHPISEHSLSMSVFMYLFAYILRCEYTCESKYVDTCVHG